MDRETLLKAWELFRDANPYEICDGREFKAIRELGYCMEQMVLDTIALMKEQEANPIVRCNECRYSGLPYYDTLKCSKDGKVHYENWFCADGERRT